MIESIPIEHLEIYIGTSVGILGLLTLIMFFLIRRSQQREQRKRDILARIEPVSSSYLSHSMFQRDDRTKID